MAALEVRLSELAPTHPSGFIVCASRFFDGRETPQGSTTGSARNPSLPRLCIARPPLVRRHALESRYCRATAIVRNVLELLAGSQVAPSIVQRVLVDVIYERLRHFMQPQNEAVKINRSAALSPVDIPVIAAGLGRPPGVRQDTISISGIYDRLLTMIQGNGDRLRVHRRTASYGDTPRPASSRRGGFVLSKYSTKSLKGSQ